MLNTRAICAPKGSPPSSDSSVSVSLLLTATHVHSRIKGILARKELQAVGTRSRTHNVPLVETLVLLSAKPESVAEHLQLRLRCRVEIGLVSEVGPLLCDFLAKGQGLVGPRPPISDILQYMCFQQFTNLRFICPVVASGFEPVALHLLFVARNNYVMCPFNVLHIQQSVASRIKSSQKLTALGPTRYVSLTDTGFDKIGASKRFALHGGDAAGYNGKLYPWGGRLPQLLSLLQPC